MFHCSVLGNVYIQVAIIIITTYMRDTASTFAGIRPDFNRTDLAKFEKKTFPAAGSRIESKCVGECGGHDNDYFTNGIY